VVDSSKPFKDLETKEVWKMEPQSRMRKIERRLAHHHLLPNRGQTIPPKQ